MCSFLIELGKTKTDYYCHYFLYVPPDLVTVFNTWPIEILKYSIFLIVSPMLFVTYIDLDAISYVCFYFLLFCYNIFQAFLLFKI